MRTLTLLIPVLGAACAILPAAAAGDDNRQDTNGSDIDRSFELEQLEVSERRVGGFESYRVEPAQSVETGADPSRLMRGVPGGNFNSNGPLAGQIQYRGMFGPRVNTRIDGMYINSGGPNWMDPPTHYAPRSQVESIEVHRGLAPVSAGPEAIGGTVNIETRSSRFSDSDALETQGSIQGGFQSVNDGVSGGAMVGLANRNHRLHVVGGGIDSDDTEFSSESDLEIRPTEQQRSYLGIGYGLRESGHEISLDYRYFDTDKAGNPSLPLDTELFETQLFNAAYEGSIGDIELDGRLKYSDIDHSMSNVALRTAPNFFGPPLGQGQSMAPPPFRGRDQRRIRAESDGLGGELNASTAVTGGTLTLGTNFHLSDHNARVSDPDSNFAAVPFNDIDRNRYSVFGEWLGSFSERWRLTTGLRYTRVAMEAGEGTAPGLPPAQRLQDEFNARDRERDDNLVDAVIEFERRLTPDATLELGLGRKTRAPSYIERFAWIPIEATAGLADGNNHVGDVDLDPETSHQIELGLNWTTNQWYFTPRAFYRDVDDYIQGVPVPQSETDLITVSRVNGDPTPLRFSNVEAEFFGVDSGFGARFSEHWRGDGTISYVRGRRDDTDDDLFRIAPLNGTLSLSYELRTWRFTAESVWAASQDKVSEANDEPESDGFAIYNLKAQWRSRTGISVTAGIENVFDDLYRDHLAGFNRVAESDVGGATAPPATQENRIPGPGRNLSARVAYSW